MNFLERLRKAAENDLEYWDQRRPPKENMSRRSFERILKQLPDDIKPQWGKRKSQGGKHGLDGEENVFQFTAELNRFGKVKIIYIKGFFFTKTKPSGVEIQSCRWTTKRLKDD